MCVCVCARSHAYGVICCDRIERFFYRTEDQWLNLAPPQLNIDNRYVVDGICAVIDGRAEPYLRGPDADLWKLLLDADPRSPPTWVPAHKTIDRTN